MDELIQKNQKIFIANHYIQRFIQYTDRKKTTTVTYIRYLKKFVVWLMKENIDKPERSDIIAYKEELKNSDLKVSTQAQYLRAVKHFFRFLASENLYPNIADNIHTPKTSRFGKKDCFEKEDIKILIDKTDHTIKGKRLKAIILLEVICGLRCIEVSRINIDDLRRSGGKLYLYIQGKGRDEKDAAVLIINEVETAINEYLQARGIYNPKGALFISESNRDKGKRLKANSISKLLKNHFKNCGYNSSRLTAHSLRHTSGTIAYKATKNIYVVQQHQRHESIENTEIYMHIANREERETEKQVYNYIFSDKDLKTKTTIKKLQKQLEIMNELQLEKVDNFINLIEL
jgi:integrase/recombinase XerC